MCVMFCLYTIIQDTDREKILAYQSTLCLFVYHENTVDLWFRQLTNFVILGIQAHGKILSFILV